MRIVLTPGQAVLAHGWIRAREYLTWSDILNHEHLTFSYLCETMRISEMMLHHLQPDLQAWIKNHKVRLEDCPRMSLWGAHPIKDFNADLADLVRMRWQTHQFKAMGVTYDSLLQLGLTAETMVLFGFTLVNWTEIGFRRTHCENIPEAILFRLFTLSKQQVMGCLR